jgi:hypothetical protein
MLLEMLRSAKPERVEVDMTTVTQLQFQGYRLSEEIKLVTHKKEQ